MSKLRTNIFKIGSLHVINLLMLHAWSYYHEDHVLDKLDLCDFRVYNNSKLTKSQI